MPRAEHQPVNALLPAAAGERRDIGVDEIDRQAVHKVSVLRQSPDRGQPGAGWHKGRASSRAPPDATDGPGGSIQAAKDEPAASGPSGLPLLAEGYGDHASQSGLVLGHHLHPGQPGISLPRCHHGLGNAQGAELAGVEYDACRLLCRCAERGHRKS